MLQIAKVARNDVRVVNTLAYTALGEAFVVNGKGFSVDFPASEADLGFAKRFWEQAEVLLETGRIRPHPVDLRHGGLEKILEGVDELRNDKVSGKKVVYTL